MPTTYVRKGTSGRGTWSEENLGKAIHAVEEKVMGVNEAAAAFGIPKTTLKRRVKSGNYIKGSMGKCSVLGSGNENKIIGHIKKLQAHGFTPSRGSVQSMAFNLAEMLNINHTFNREAKKAGYDWLVSFLARNPELSIRQSEGVSINRAKGLNKQTVKRYFDLLESVLMENNLLRNQKNVFNMDEAGLQMNNTPGKVIAMKGSRNVTSVTSGEKGETISVLACVNGEGNFLLPYSIMKGKNLKKEFCDGMPPGSEVKMSQKSAYVTSEIFFDWLKTFFFPRKPPGKVLLLLDSHSSHTSCIEMLEFAEENNIIMMSIPPHTSHWLQPLDRSFFKSLKAHFYSACNSYVTNNPSRKITRLQFGQLLHSGWGKSASVANGVNGFKSCGIIPFNPSAIPDYAFLSENPVATETAQPQNVQTNDIEDSERSSTEDLAIAGPSGLHPVMQGNVAENQTPTKLLNNIHPVPSVGVRQTPQMRRRINFDYFELSRKHNCS